MNYQFYANNCFAKFRSFVEQGYQKEWIDISHINIIIQIETCEVSKKKNLFINIQNLYPL